MAVIAAVLAIGTQVLFVPFYVRSLLGYTVRAAIVRVTGGDRRGGQVRGGAPGGERPTGAEQARTPYSRNAVLIASRSGFCSCTVAPDGT